MNKSTSYQYFHNSKASTLDVIMHGGSKGIESSFIKKLFEGSIEKGNSVISFNFPYLERGEENSSGPKLEEEVSTLRFMLSKANSKEYSLIRLVGKSLGGIVASYYLSNLSKKEKKLYEVIILGYVTGDVKLGEFDGKITIIQGEQDRFGNVKTVKKDLKKGISNKLFFYEIKGADHSYREPDTKEPIYEELVVDLVKTI